MFLFYVVGQNHKDVLIVVDSEDYQAVLEYLKGGQSDQQFRRKLAWKAFQHVAAYDSAVSEWLWKQTEASMWLFLCDPSYIRKTYIFCLSTFHNSHGKWGLTLDCYSCLSQKTSSLPASQFRFHLRVLFVTVKILIRRLHFMLIRALLK